MCLKDCSAGGNAFSCSLVWARQLLEGLLLLLKAYLQ